MTILPRMAWSPVLRMVVGVGGTVGVAALGAVVGRTVGAGAGEVDVAADVGAVVALGAAVDVAAVAAACLQAARVRSNDTSANVRSKGPFI